MEEERRNLSVGFVCWFGVVVEPQYMLLCTDPGVPKMVDLKFSVARFV